MAINKPIDTKLFVRVWMQAHREGRDQQWVAKQIARTQSAAYSISTRLRKRGVKLPPLPSGKRGNQPLVTTNDLNRIVEEESNVKN
jgi:phage terminase large subunit-like protein